MLNMILKITIRLFLLFAITHNSSAPVSAQPNSLPVSLTMPKFGVLIRELSEPGQEFHTDNFTSNETSYLHPLPVLRKLDLSNGVYVGVGPEQNFTYIGAIRPKMAFIVDIRHQNLLQHLMYKALFTLSSSRAEFLSKLLSKPLYEDLPFIRQLFRRPPAWMDSGAEPSIEELVDYFDSVDAMEKLYEQNLSEIKALVRSCGFDSLDDMNKLEYIYRAFYRRQLRIRYDHSIQFPELRDLLMESTLEGEMAGFLADEQKFRFVKDMQSRNLIVPIVGDFSGDRALHGIANYVRTHGAVISVFYTSNVESYLLASGYSVFSSFIENVRHFPIDESSVFIRSFHNGGHPRMRSHPDQVAGHPFTTLVQPVSFLLEKKQWISLWGIDLYRYIVTNGNLY